MVLVTGVARKRTGWPAPPAAAGPRYRPPAAPASGRRTDRRRSGSPNAGRRRPATITSPDSRMSRSDMAHHIMAHLMAQHRQHFVRRALFQQIVVQGDAGGAEKARDIGGDAVGLPRGVHQPDIVGGNVIGARQRQDLRFQRALRQGRIMIEQRRDEDGIDHRHQNLESDRQPGAPQPPVLPRPPDGGIEQRQEDQRGDQGQRQADAEIAQPGQEVLVGQAIGMFAEKAFIERERKLRRRDDGDIGGDIDHRLIGAAAGAFRRPVAHGGRKCPATAAAPPPPGPRPDPPAAANSRLRNRRRSAPAPRR